ncbi:MAG: cbiO [Bacillales bacterium]|nr:cbiO [Bacillales bacterium]
MGIKFKNVSYTYQANTPFEKKALKDITLEISSGTFTAIIGHTGSGKSTLIQHLNALLLPEVGTIAIDDIQIDNRKALRLKQLRKKVGVVFQFPEQQLFEETVLKDIMFGPINFGLSENEAINVAQETATLIGLDVGLLDKSPFELSGGQMRKVAIAGILASKPKILVLDEPTAGLDPKGKKQLMELIRKLNKEEGITIILVTHNMEDALKYADRFIVMHEGKILFNGGTEIFNQEFEIMSKANLSVPFPLSFLNKFENKFNVQINKDIRTLEDALEKVTPHIKQVKYE